jgi:hypothetical protein
MTEEETPRDKAHRLWEEVGYNWASAVDYASAAVHASAAYLRGKARYAKEHPPKEAEP